MADRNVVHKLVDTGDRDVTWQEPLCCRIPNPPNRTADWRKVTCKRCLRMKQGTRERDGK